MNQNQFIVVVVAALAATGVSALIAMPHIEQYVDEKLGKKVEEKISEIIGKISKLETERIPKLEAQLEVQESIHNLLSERVDGIFNTPARMSVEDKGYGIARTPYGTLTISAVNTSPYLDGYKIALSIGNLTSATLKGAEVSVVWGLPLDLNNFQAYQKSRKSKKFKVTNDFPSGAYTDVEVALTPAKPEEIKTISVGVAFDTISLRILPKQK